MNNEKNLHDIIKSCESLDDRYYYDRTKRLHSLLSCAKEFDAQLLFCLAEEDQTGSWKSLENFDSGEVTDLKNLSDFIEFEIYFPACNYIFLINSCGRPKWDYIVDQNKLLVFIDLYGNNNSAYKTQLKITIYDYS